MNIIIQNLSIILLVVAVLCTLITAITEFIKEFGPLKKVPTNLVVLVISLVVCTLAFFSALSYFAIQFVWYYLVAVIFASIIIAILCCKGWEYFFTLWKRFYKKDIK